MSAMWTKYCYVLRRILLSRLLMFIVYPQGGAKRHSANETTMKDQKNCQKLKCKSQKSDTIPRHIWTSQAAIPQLGCKRQIQPFLSSGLVDKVKCW